MVAFAVSLGMTAGCGDAARTADATAGAAAAGSTASQPIDASGSEIYRLERVADGVYATVVLDGISPSQYATSLIVIRSDHVLVVDSRHDAASADELIATTRGLTDLPVKYVVDTHWHGDHVQGNARFREVFPDVRLIGGTTADEDMRTLGRRRLDQQIERVEGRVAAARGWLESGVGEDGVALTEDEREALPEQIAEAERYLEARRAIRLIPPEITVEHELRLDDAEPAVEIVKVGPAHTRGDVIVRIPARGVIAIGDLVEDGFPWFGDGFPAGWAEAMDRIAGMLDAMQADGAAGSPILLGGHGPVLRDRAMFETQRAFVHRIVEAASSAAGADAGVEAAIESADLDEFREHLTRRVEGDAAAKSERFAGFVAEVMERAYAEASGQLEESP